MVEFSQSANFFSSIEADSIRRAASFPDKKIPRQYLSIFVSLIRHRSMSYDREEKTDATIHAFAL
jgi:hypothetical protein